MTNHNLHYVCSATEGQIINLMPLLHLGLGNVSTVLQLVGSGGTSTIDEDVRARLPARYLEQAVHQISTRSGVAPPRMMRLTLPADAVSLWSATLRKQFEDIEPSSIVANLTGGTRSMMLGAIGGLPEGARGLLFFSNPARIKWFQWTLPESDAPDELCTAQHLVQLGDILQLQGFAERDPAGRISREARALEATRIALTVAILNRLAGRHIQWEMNQSAISFNTMTRKWPQPDRVAQRPLVLEPGELKGDTLAHATWFAGACEEQGVTLFRGRTDGSFEFEDADAVRYAGGGWFEEWAFAHCVASTMGPKAPPPAHMGVTVSTMAGSSAAREIDVMLAVEGQVHVVECKAGIVGDADGGFGVNRETISKFSAVKTRHVGGGGTATLLCLQTPWAKGRATELQDFAKAHGIRLLWGSSGLQSFENDIGKLVRR